jgi:hypothetical protein
MASKKKAQERRDLAKNPAVHPLKRRYLTQLNTTGVFGTTSTTTTTTTSTTSTSTTTTTGA